MSVFDSTGTWRPKTKVKLNLDQQGTKLLNLTVLQRIDPCIEQILITASRVSLYNFNTDLNQWNRKDVEGSLFVVKRNAEPRFQFIVMNRLNAENYVEHLVRGFEYEVHVPYILYRNALEEVNGIWFYVADDCEEAAKLFSRILGAKSKVYPKSPVISGKSELHEPEAVPSSAVIEAPLEPTPSAACSRGRPEDSSVILFSTAMTTGYGSQDNIQFGQLVDKKRPCGSLSHVSDAIRSCGSNLSSSPVISVSVPTMNLGERCEPLRNSQPANLLKPSCLKVSVATPSVTETPGTSLASASAFHHLMTTQHQNKTQFLPEFPPPPSSPTLPPLLSATPILTSNYGQINRERLRYALQTLIQDNQFIDMVYQALLKVHES